jgi:hypothetical protein
MTIALYMDVHVHKAITDALRQRGVNVKTAQEDGTDILPDPDLLDRSTALGYALCTYDADFLVEAARRQHTGETFAGLIHVHFTKSSIGKCIDDLELLAKANDPPDMLNHVEYVPL